MIFSFMNIPEYINIWSEILNTIILVFIPTFFAYLFGFPLGVLAVITDKDGMKPNKILNQILGFIINLGRSIPFLILLVLLIPLSRSIVGTSIGVAGTIVPLTIGAIPFVARLVENSLKEVDKRVVDAAICMGASKFQVITRVYLVEALPSLIRGVSITLIMLIGYSAMTGATGGDGLGAIAITEGYERLNTELMWWILLIIIIIVEIIQIAFDIIVKIIDKRR